MKFSIVGMANAKRVWIAKIFLVSDYPIDLLYNVANPHEPSLTTCCLSWGEGIIKED